MGESEIQEQARAIAAMPFRITAVYDDEDGYISRAVEFPYFAGVEDTAAAAEATLREAIALAAAIDLREGRIPRQPLAASAR